MKKLLKKRILIPLAVAVAVAIAAGTAYALFSTTASSATNNLGTGSTPSLTVTPTTAVDLTGLIPANSAAGGKTVQYTMNINTVGCDVAMNATTTGAWTDPNVAKRIHVTVDDNALTYQGAYYKAADLPWSGTLADLMSGQVALIQNSDSNTNPVVTIKLWLDAGVDNSFANLTGTVQFNFTSTLQPVG